MKNGDKSMKLKVRYPWLFGAFLLLSLLCLSTKEAPCQINRDIVFLIDCSTSVEDVFPRLKAAMKEYVSEAKEGDKVIIISFGDTAELFFRKKMRHLTDISRLQAAIDELRCPYSYTYITKAIDLGIEELYKLYGEEESTNLRLLILLTDGKNNPPPTPHEVLTFEEILDAHPEFKPGKDWFMYYVALKREADTEVRHFVDKAKGLVISNPQDLFFGEIEVEPASLDLGIMPSTMTSVKEFVLTFHPKKTSLLDTQTKGEETLKVIASFRENPAQERLLEIEPKSFSFKEDSWMEHFTLPLPRQPEGIYQGQLTFTSTRGIMLIQPPRLPFQMTYMAPRIEVTGDEALTFGPVELGKEFLGEATFFLVPNEAAEGYEVEVVKDMPLPKGMSLDVSLTPMGRRQRVDVSLSARADAPLPPEETLSGSIQLTTAEEAVRFTRQTVPIEVTTGKAPPTVTRANRILMAGKDFLRKHQETLLGSLVFTLVGLLVGLFFLAYLFTREKAYIDGRLIFTQKPADMKRSFINLKHLCLTKGKNTLTIGSSPTADITLPHSSIKSISCVLWAGKGRLMNKVYIGYTHDQSSSVLVVNDKKLDQSPKELNNGDIIRIGPYSLIYEDMSLFRQVVVHFLDGKVLLGFPMTWDLEKEGFFLRPMDQTSLEALEYVKFYELKAVFFVKDWDGDIARKIRTKAFFKKGYPVTLIFQDGEVFHGYLPKNYDPRGDRFYIIPPDKDDNTIYALVEKTNLLEMHLAKKR